MSRKLRIEQLKLKQLNAEVQEELDRVKLQREKIYAPIIWKQLPGLGLQIQDLKEPNFEETMQLIKNNYFEDDLLCRNINLAGDPVSMESYLQRILFHMKYRQSIIAVHKESKEVAGVLMLKTVQTGDYGRIFGRVQMTSGQAFKEIMRFLGQIDRKIDVLEHFGVDTYLDYILLSVKQSYRHNGIGYQLMDCGLKVARAQNCPVTCGIFDTHSLQKTAAKIGMKILYRMSYLDWKDEDGELIFSEPGPGNYFCAVMGGEVPPPPPPPPPPKVEVVAEEVKKMTRVERIALIQSAQEKAKANRKSVSNIIG